MTREAIQAQSGLAEGVNLGAGFEPEVIALIVTLANCDLKGGNRVIHPTATGGLIIEKAPSVSIVDRAPDFFAHNEQQ